MRRFRHLAWDLVASAGLPVRPGTIRKQDPPAPDVMCTLTGGGDVAFELVEVIDSNWARAWSDGTSVCERVREALHAAPVPTLSNAMITLRIRRDVAKQERTAAVGVIVEELKALPREFEGELELSPSLRDHVTWGLVGRGEFVGPVVDPDLTSFLADRLFEALQQKYGRRYESEAPVELVVYYQRQPMRPLSTQPPLDSYLRDFVATSGYRRVWIFDQAMRRVAAVYPPL